MKQFETFIRDRVISTFHKQRATNYDHFAVIILAEGKSLYSLTSTRFELARTGLIFNPLVNSSYTSYLKMTTSGTILLHDQNRMKYGQLHILKMPYWRDLID